MIGIATMPNNSRKPRCLLHVPEDCTCYDDCAFETLRQARKKILEGFSTQEEKPKKRRRGIPHPDADRQKYFRERIG